MAKSPTPPPTDMLSALPAELSSRLFAKVRPVSLGADQTLFLAGDNWPEIIRACLILSLYFIVLLAATQRFLRKRLG